MKTYNLITEAEKQAVTDAYKYSEIIRQEALSHFEITERAKQLIAFRDQYNEQAKLTRIRLKVEVMELARLARIGMVDRLTSLDITGLKIYKVDGALAKKYEGMFDIPTDEVGVGQPKGHRVRGYVRRGHLSGRDVDLFVDVDVWENGERSSYSTRTAIIELEADGQTVKGFCEIPAGEPIVLEAELARAKAYLDYKAETEARLRELRRACNTYVLEVVERENPSL